MTPLLLFSTSGALLGYLKIYTRESNTGLINASINLLYPMFITILVAQSISRMSSYHEFWQLQLSTNAIIVLGLGLGLLLVTVVPPPSCGKYTVISTVALPNLGNIPVLITQGVCSSYGPMYGHPECSQIQGYCLIMGISFNILIWAVFYPLILKDAHLKAKLKVEQYFSSVNDDKSSLLSAALDSPLPPQVSLSLIVQGALSRPIPIACFAGVIIGSIPEVGKVFFDNEAPLRFLVNSLLSTGFLSIMIPQQILGFNIGSQVSNYHPIDSKIIAAVALSRLILIPLLMQCLVYFALRANVLSYGIGFVIMVGSATPSGIATMTLNQILDVGIEVSSVILMFIYPLSVFTLTVHCSMFFALNPTSLS
jgi:hypothetical protein